MKLLSEGSVNITEERVNKSMEIYGLSGKSGTGKSYQAITLCRERDFDAIIDDGLFICDSRVVAGKSAKRQATKIGAVKTALFHDQEHCDQVADAIELMRPNKMLVLGTSVEMIQKICKRLGLPEPQGVIYIEDITTEEERQLAHHQRHDLGRHIIPVPTMQVKRQFSGYMMYPIRMFRGFGSKANADKQDGEKTVVRPTYSYIGEFSIGDQVICDIAEQVGEDTEGVADVTKVHIQNNDADELTLWVQVYMNYGVPLIETARKMQAHILKETERMTAFHVNAVHVEVRGLK